MKQGQWELIDAYPGAHIRVRVSNFYHHGIYIGNDQVVQFGLPNSLYKDHSEIEVLLSPIKDFMGSSDFYEVYVYSSKEKRQKLPDDMIIKNALSHIGERNYNVLNNNCEHFANLCVFGKKKSLQIDDIYKNVEELLKK